MTDNAKANLRKYIRIVILIAMPFTFQFPTKNAWIKSQQKKPRDGHNLFGLNLKSNSYCIHVGTVFISSVPMPDVGSKQRLR